MNDCLGNTLQVRDFIVIDSTLTSRRSLTPAIIIKFNRNRVDCIYLSVVNDKIHFQKKTTSKNERILKVGRDSVPTAIMNELYKESNKYV